MTRRENLQYSHMDHKIYPKRIWANSTISASMTKKEKKLEKKKKQAK